MGLCSVDHHCQLCFSGRVKHSMEPECEFIDDPYVMCANCRGGSPEDRVYSDSDPDNPYPGMRSVPWRSHLVDE